MDHGRQTKDGVSLARAGSEAVQTVPRAPTTIMPLAPPDVVAAFLEFVLHVVPQQHRGAQVPDDEPWKHLDR
jgi:hypothetical protein